MQIKKDSSFVPESLNYNCPSTNPKGANETAGDKSSLVQDKLL